MILRDELFGEPIVEDVVDNVADIVETEVVNLDSKQCWWRA